MLTFSRKTKPAQLLTSPILQRVPQQSHDEIATKRDATAQTGAFNHDFSRVPIVQPKLTINNPDDQYEREADAVAEQVRNSQAAHVQPTKVSNVQRKCAECEEEDKKKLQLKSSGGKAPVAERELENYVGGLQSKGRPLPDEVRNHYEPRFGYDFSQVRVHTDGAAAKSAETINALAYTSGNNIVFNAGQFSPFTDNGSRLLAHELTHVAQQQSGLVQPKVIQRDNGPGDDPFARDPLAVQPGGPFDVGDTICTIQFGGRGWEACCPIPGAAAGSENACFNNESLDEVRNWVRRRGLRLPEVNCPPGRLPNLMLGSCCPEGQIPRGIQCVEPQAVPPPAPCPPQQRTLSGRCCTPPSISVGTGCITLPQQGPSVPAPAPSGGGLNFNFTLVLDDFNINEHGINNRQRTNWNDIRRRLHQLMEGCPRSFMVVTGFADTPGTDEYNLSLGQRRADTVRMSLELSLVDIPAALPLSIASRSEGRSNPVDVAATSYSARNRRVEIQFFSVCPSLTLTPPRLTPPSLTPRQRNP